MVLFTALLDSFNVGVTVIVCPPGYNRVELGDVKSLVKVQSLNVSRLF